MRRAGEGSGALGLRFASGGPHGAEAAVRARDDVWVVDSGAGGVGGEAAGAEAAERGDQPGPLCVAGAQGIGAAGAAGRVAGGEVRRGGDEPAVFGWRRDEPASEEVRERQFPYC